MRKQKELLYVGKERESLFKALSIIGACTKAGAFTKKAQEAQKKYHSTISIIRKLKKLRTITHFDET